MFRFCILQVKDKADILEAFIGALYVDQGLDPCLTFCQVCFYPRLKVIHNVSHFLQPF